MPYSSCNPIGVILKKPLRAGSERISGEKGTCFYPKGFIVTRRLKLPTR